MSALFDISFSTFVTPMIIKVVYVLAMIALGIASLIFVISGFASGEPLLGLVILLFAPLGFVIYLCFVRMTLEFYLAVVRMSEDINRRLPRA